MWVAGLCKTTELRYRDHSLPVFHLVDDLSIFFKPMKKIF